MKKIVLYAIASITLISCIQKIKTEKENGNSQDHLIMSVLWYRKSAEMRALYYQAYNIAASSLEKKIGNLEPGKAGAVVLDIDETILDNSLYEVELIRNRMDYSGESWKTWVEKSSATACPGALEFVKYADSLGAEVFYVTNRKLQGEYQPTLDNLKNLGFPFADSLHLLMRIGSGAKEERRKLISENYEILILAGDNLADLDSVFDIRGDDLGFSATDKNRNKFGADFIVLPNPMYGAWADAAVEKSKGEAFLEKAYLVLGIK